MKKSLLLIAGLLASVLSFAAHIVGGEMIYEYLGPAANGNLRYRITLRLFRDDLCMQANCASMPTEVFIGIFDNGTGAQIPAFDKPYTVPRSFLGKVPVGTPPDCVVNAPQLDYSLGEFTLTVDLPPNIDGYSAAYQTCCRVNPMTNVYNTSAQGGGTGSTYSCNIPGTAALGANATNSSAQFATYLSPICQGKPFTLDFSATDPDGDSLVYVFCEAYNGGEAQGAQNINPAAPPYGTVPYINGYTAGKPLGLQATVDSKTGIISGIAPPVGRYVVCVCVYEYRDGKLISTHRKDFMVNVANCDYAGADLEPSYTFCESLTASFQNLNTSDLNRTYYWDFGDGNSSTELAPSHTYADTGTYTVKLVINRGEPCGDSITTRVQVYPLFQTDFSVAGGCVNKTTSFTDRTIVNYGTITSWNWSFGDGATANTQNPQTTFTTTGTKTVQLITTSSKGCMDTTVKTFDITDKPFIDLLFNDTLICAGDQLQLSALGTGSFTWTPGTNVTNANTATPTVSPANTTQYIVRLDQDGCINFDTVQVRVVNQVTLAANADTVICATDPIQLGASTNGLQFSWTPAAGLSNPNIVNPIATPVANTTYQLTATIGGCTATDDIEVAVVPYPVANAGADTVICYDTQAQLQGSINGNRFTWTPSSGLSNAASLNPVVRLTESRTYLLSAYDNLGCPKPGTDTVTIIVLPQIIADAGRDTVVVVGQPLQLLASGGTQYLWTPSTGLNDNNIPNPVGVYSGNEEQVQYKVYMTNEAGCLDSATVAVRIFKTAPQVFVPTAFTPNGDGSNDIFRPIPVGVTRITYFRVYNRWGELVFQNTDGRSGWDGRIGGALQGSGTFVWLVEGIDYTGKKFTSKGTVTLIR